MVLTPPWLIQRYFAASAAATILVLLLILAFLLRESVGFLPAYRSELETYRRSGLEFCDIAREPLKHQQVLASLLRRAKAATADLIRKQELADAEIAFDAAIAPVSALLDQLGAIAQQTKALDTEAHTMEATRQQLLAAAASTQNEATRKSLLAEAADLKAAPVDFSERITLILQHREELAAALGSYTVALAHAATKLPNDTALISQVRAAIPRHVSEVKTAAAALKEWQWDRHIPWHRAIVAFFFGSHWITNSPWQDFYGFIPLLVGSAVIALIAVCLATPISVISAIYTSQFAGAREKEIIKPVIEFIQAIPSVVFGFIGISFLGDAIKGISEWHCLQWVPGFPIQERLNMFNAGCLLAFMAVPTMFSLAEDALNNVPRAYIDASDALGATKLQTVFRVIVPAGIHGILSAILLGLGRVLGETMIVLLVAGNRIAIPDFSAGPGVVFQPAHTLTGIIAQELGEVSRGSTHWQALFMIGSVLFAIALFVNWCARAVARRFEPCRT